MNEFIELTVSKNHRVLVNIDKITNIVEESEYVIIYFIDGEIKYVKVLDSFESIKQKLGLIDE